MRDARYRSVEREAFRSTAKRVTATTALTPESLRPKVAATDGFFHPRVRIHTSGFPTCTWARFCLGAPVANASRTAIFSIIRTRL